MLLGHVVGAARIQHEDHRVFGVKDPQGPAVADFTFDRGENQPARLVGVPVLLLLVVLDQLLVDRLEQRGQPLQSLGQRAQG